MTAVAVRGLEALEGEPSRAVYPDADGYVERDGVRSFYEVYGTGDPTILLLPTWSIVHSRFWKAQIAYLARHFRVLTFDGRGNGRSDRPQDADAYGFSEFAEDAIAVMDATETENAILVSASLGTLWNLHLCGVHADRVLGTVFIGPVFPLADEWPAWSEADVVERRETYEGAQRYNVHFIRENLAGFAAWWAELAVPEPHSTWAIESTIRYALCSDGETIALTVGAAEAMGVRTMREVFEAMRPMFEAMAAAVSCPALVLEGELDAITPVPWARSLAEHLGGELRLLPGIGHATARRPVPFNLAIRDFVEGLDDD